MDAKTCANIAVLVEKLSTTGKDVIDEKLMKNLVPLAGQSEEYLKFTTGKLMHQLNQNHSEIRFGTFLVIEVLFKSGYFRELLLDDFQNFLELTVESDPDKKQLPPPKEAAKKLKRRVLQSIQKWHAKFGDRHKRLTLSYNFLKNCLKVDFQDALQRNESELLRAAREQERINEVNSKKALKVETELTENEDEISRVLQELENCFELLIPKPEGLFGENTEDNYSEEPDFRAHGLPSSGQGAISVEVNVKEITKTEDNAVIIEKLHENCTLINSKYLPLVKSWIKMVAKTGNERIFKKVLEIRNTLTQEIRRVEELKIVSCKDDKLVYDEKYEDSDDDDVDEFEEVPEKDGYEPEAYAPPIPITKSIDTQRPCSSRSLHDSTSWRLMSDGDVTDPTTYQATLAKLNCKRKIRSESEVQRSTSSNISETDTTSSFTETDRKAKLLKVAPKIPFDIDLYHWEDKDLKAPSVEIVERDGHKFWTPAQDREGETVEDPNGIASLRTRVIEFSGSFEPVRWACRAPLPSGKLCPRRDRIKCPLHGLVIPRDELGNPTRDEDIKKLEAEKERKLKEKVPEWQDPEFLKDIEAQTGMDLTIKPPKKGRSKKKSFKEIYPGLTDIDKKKNTPRSRLERKVFNKNAVRRVADTLDELSEKRFQDKFGDQWNYAMNND